MSVLKVILIVGGFLGGGIMFSRLLPQRILNRDICAISADGNPGAFNAFKHCGAFIGSLCMVCDVLKGFLPVFLASLITEADSIAFPLIMAAPALGHAVGVFNRFHGGKCIAVAFGIMLGVIPVTPIPILTLAALYLVFSTVLRIRNGAKRSVTVFVLFAAITCAATAATGQPHAAVGCGIVAALPVIKFLFSKNGMVDNRFKGSGEESALHGKSRG